MKIISLNIWRGKAYRELEAFIKEHSQSADIFCFQEVYDAEEEPAIEGQPVHDIYRRISSLLKDFSGYHSPAIETEENGKRQAFGLAIFYRSSLEIKGMGTFEVFRHDEKLDLPDGLKMWNRLVQYVQLPYRNGLLNVCNFHGMYNGGDKLDNLARMEQSRRVAGFLEKLPGEKILCGDFNLNPNTESLKMLESGLRNLTKEYNIATTRNRLYALGEEMPLADYALVTPGVKVAGFSVPYAEASDHLPLILEIE